MSKSTDVEEISKGRNGIEEKKDKKEKEEKAEGGACSTYKGLFLAFLSGLLMTVYTTLIQELENMDTMVLVIIRGFLQLLITGINTVHRGVPFLAVDNRRANIILLMVAIIVGIRLLLVFASFAMLPLGDSTAILFSQPVVVMLLSVFLLQEACGLYRLVAAASLLAGVLLISKPPALFGYNEEQQEQHYPAKGYVICISACVMSATGYVLTKLITEHVDKVVILFHIGLGSMVCGFLGLGLSMVGVSSTSTSGIDEMETWPGYQDWVLAIIIALVGIAQMYLVIWAL